MIIMGIDPGTARVGWGVIETEKTNYRARAYGCITTKISQTPGQRLVSIYSSLLSIIHNHKPDCLVIEELFFSVNAKTAIPVGQARGVILLAAEQQHIPVRSYAPLVIKQTITNDGRAQKKQMQRMVQLLLKLKSIPQPDDTADALATALTHAVTKRYV